jgi:hypothetical protein
MQIKFLLRQEKDLLQKHVFFQIGVYCTLYGCIVGASIARPAVLYHKTASPQGDISSFSFVKSTNCIAICWRTANGRPYNAPSNGAIC